MGLKGREDLSKNHLNFIVTRVVCIRNEVAGANEKNVREVLHKGFL